MHLAVQFPAAGSTTAPTGPRPGRPHSTFSSPSSSSSSSPSSFSSFRHLAATAERGLFDFFLVPDDAGGPEPVTVLSALAAVTERIGLAAGGGTTFTEPYEPARRLASLDHLSDGRAAWDVGTPSDGYARAAEFVAAARALWDSWTPGGVPRPFSHHGTHFSLSGTFDVARGPQGHPVVLHAGDSEEGREFAASAADVVLTRRAPGDRLRAFAADVGRRLAAYGRQPGELKVMPCVTFALGDTDAEAQENAAEIRKQQVSPQNALLALERVWGRDFSGCDPDGPLPRTGPDPTAEAARWRAVAEAEGLSVRQTVIEMTGRQTFVGSPASVAAQLDECVASGAADGFVLLPHLAPGGLDEFADRVVPLLQERGAFRTEYTGATLREHLGLPLPVWKG
ncbi:NtaA/DmoA family FMN-dependent monooxygenase [Streptomyces sp. URMC 127]|uniref:NtaA/DmoA family FMN-dependent monooxygenase n=1 Tax=Streptomyces sp. URMC 127 TaxID=3423402 RepID=UPI003F1BD811